ncbi:MAG: polynucleotide adenylyltransferase PcnB [Treponema sp.]|jgi:poly(A) polymerase|nr:polynucleotide adenylyltransferase PcnB [Treponema sp.]
MRYRYSATKDGKHEKKAAIYTKDEHGIDVADVDSEAVSIVRKLKHAGFDTYIVGGAVRDLILGKKPKDFDIVSAASPSRIKKLFRNSRIIGRRFRLVHIYFGQRIFEAATFRSLKDGNTSNTFGKIDEDVFRRDFTMNALFYDPEQQIVVDYVGGMDDIKKKQVVPVIPLSEIFADDPVRMIRAVKYAAATDFSLPMNLKLKIKKQSGLLASVSPSRLTEEIFKIIHSNKAAVIVDMLDKMGLYCYLQPEAVKLMRKNKDFRQRYLKTLAALNGEEKYRGHIMGSLFYDYLETIGEWKPGVIENYREIFQIARSFVLPMNPPRFEMEHALRSFLSARGITIKRTHPFDRTKPAHDGETTPAAKKRRRRRKPKPAPAPAE